MDANNTLFDAKISNYSVARTIIAKNNLKKISKSSTVNGTYTSEEILYNFGVSLSSKDSNNATVVTYSAIDAVIPTK